jgi:hypothetical protein
MLGTCDQESDKPEQLLVLTIERSGWNPRRTMWFNTLMSNNLCNTRCCIRFDNLTVGMRPPTHDSTVLAVFSVNRYYLTVTSLIYTVSVHGLY